MQEISGLCLELAVADLLPLSPEKRARAIDSLGAIDQALAQRLRLAICLAIS